MSAVIGAVRAMLTANGDLTAVVPEDRITAGEIPQDTLWPAIILTHVVTERQGHIAFARGEEHLRTTIDVIPLAKGYAQMDSIVQLIEAACHGQRGVFAGVSVHSAVRYNVAADEFFDEQGLWSRPVSIQLIYTRP